MDEGEGKKCIKDSRVRKRERGKSAICERLQSFLTPSSVPADSMSRPTLQQGQSRAISQAYSALLRPCSSDSTKGLVGTPQSLL